MKKLALTIIISLAFAFCGPAYSRTIDKEYGYDHSSALPASYMNAAMAQVQSLIRQIDKKLSDNIEVAAMDKIEPVIRVSDHKINDQSTQEKPEALKAEPSEYTGQDVTKAAEIPQPQANENDKVAADSIYKASSSNAEPVADSQKSVPASIINDSSIESTASNPIVSAETETGPEEIDNNNEYAAYAYEAEPGQDNNAVDLVNEPDKLILHLPDRQGRGTFKNIDADAKEQKPQATPTT